MVIPVAVTLTWVFVLQVLLTDDYFSDINPRSMRRLMNVVYITGRWVHVFFTSLTQRVTVNHSESG